MHVVVVTPPAASLVDLAVAKKHLRVEHGDHDDLIQGHIDACADWLDGPEGILGRALGMQTLRVDRVEGFRGLCGFELPLGPARTVTEIGYRDALGVAQLVEEGIYVGDVEANRVRLADSMVWPASGGPVSITYTAGYAPGELPKSIERAILLHLNILYDQPEDKALAALERARDALLGPKRKRRV